MRRFLMTFALSAAMVAASVTVTAQEPGKGGDRPGQPGAKGERPGRPGGEGRPDFASRFRPPVLTALDKDGDGTLSAEEINNAVAALKALDKDGDGKLSRTELMGERGGFGPGGPRGPGGRGPGGRGPGGRGPGGERPERSPPPAIN